jgi:hypothetical protein
LPGIGGPHHGPDGGDPRTPDRLIGPSCDRLRYAFRDRAAPDPLVLQPSGIRIGCLHEDEKAFAVRLGPSDERVHRVGPEEGVHRQAVGLQVGPSRLQIGPRIGVGRGTDVAALASRITARPCSRAMARQRARLAIPADPNASK